jgi:hypothetical protein
MRGSISAPRPFAATTAVVSPLQEATMATRAKTRKPAPVVKGGRGEDRRDRNDDIVRERNPLEDYAFSVARDDGGCVMQHTYSSHLTYHRADGSIDKSGENFQPLDPVDTKAHPRINFRYRGTITDPINAQTPHVSDCVMVAFFDLPRGTGKWDGRIQVMCLNGSQDADGRTSVWLEYNGQRAPQQQVNDLEAGADAPRRCLFTRNLDGFKRVHRDIGDTYSEALYVSVSGCTVTLIAEATVEGADGRKVRTTKIHRINCCHKAKETL